MHVAAIQFDIAWEDKQANHRRIEQLLEDAGVPSGAFVLLPELGDTGFSFNLDTIVDDQTIQWGQATAVQRGVWLQVGYAVRGEDGRGRNCASIISPSGEVVTTYQKVYPFSYGREIEYFSGGDHLTLAEVRGRWFCPLVCYDLRFPELWRLGMQAGAQVYPIGASWPAARQSHWRTLLIARAIENQAFVVAVNRVGRDPHLAYAGGSMIIDPQGRILAEASDDEHVLQAELDFDDLDAWRRTFPALKDVRPGLLGRIPVENASGDGTA